MITIEEDNTNGFTAYDNSAEQDNTGPSAGIKDEVVPIFGSIPAIIPVSNDSTPYTVVIKTPTDSLDSPMRVDVAVTSNVLEVTIIVDGENKGMVIHFFLYHRASIYHNICQL